MTKSERAVRNYVHKLSFGVTDPARAARYGFNARNIWASWKGLLKAWVIMLLFVYAGFYAAGDSLSGRFASAVLGPVPDPLFMSSVPAVILLVAGAFLTLLSLGFTAMKVSRLTFEQLRGDQFFSEADAATFSRARWRPLLLTPLTITVGIVAGLLLLMVIGLVFRIPAAGPWIAALLALPGSFLALLLVFALVVLVLSAFLVPVITASTGGDTFEVIFELFSTVSSSPFRLFRAYLAGMLMRVPALVLLVVSVALAMNLAGGAIDLAAGTTGTAESFQSGFSMAAPEIIPAYSSIFTPVSSSAGGETSWTGIPGVLLAAGGAAVFLFIAAYWFAGCVAMWTLVYLGARHHRDGEDLLLRAEEEEYREFRKLYGSTDGAGDRRPE